MSAGARLEVEGLTRWFGARPALQEVGFAVEPGGFLVVLGPNGAGKTTLIRVLARLLRPTLGRVRLDGEDWLAAPRERQAEVGMLSHSTYLYDGLTAIENLRFYARLYGGDAERPARVALAAVGLEAVADRPAGALSRGQAQRLSIARAILHGPRLLLLDEPYAGLDPHAAARLGEALDALSAGGRTIVLTTHELDRVPAAAERWLVLVDGRVAAAGARGVGAGLRLREAYAAAMTTAADAGTRRATGAA